MTYGEEAERPTEENEDNEQSQASTGEADAEARDPKVAEIEDDPASNPQDERLRDIKGG
jgi:hypothetical protein